MKCLLLFSILFSCCVFGQTSEYYVKPVDMDAGYDPGEDSSYIIVNDAAPLNRLLFFIGGTGSSPDAYNGFLNYMGDEGFHVISISYPNDVAAASLKNDPDPEAFSKYRQELCYGTPVSDAIAVDTLNSIFTRATKLLNYLETNYPGDNWGQYLTATNEVDWSKIAIAGHSQGSGHAAYMAKFDLMERVAMFSGPNDYSDYYTAAGDWLVNDGVTPLYRYFSYLSLLDEVVPYEKQYANIQAFDLLTQGDSIHVDVNSPPYGNSHALYTTQNAGFVLLYHNTTTKNSMLNHDVWDYIFKTENLGIDEMPIQLSAYPNPSNNGLFQLNLEQEGLSYIVYNLQGEQVLSGSSNSTSVQLDLSKHKAGVYLLHCNGTITKLVLSK